MNITEAMTLAARIALATGLHNDINGDEFWGNFVRAEEIKGKGVLKFQWAPFQKRKDNIENFQKDVLDRFDLFCVNPWANRFKARYAPRPKRT